MNHENSLYPCDQCDYKTNDSNNLKTHAESTHKDVDHTEEYTLGDYTNQIADFDNVYYNCDKCKYKAGDPTLVEKHIETIHVESIKWWEGNEENVFYACKECDYNTYDTSHTNLPAHNCDHYSKTL